MSNVKWAGMPCGYTRSRAQNKRVNRWVLGLPAQRVKAQPMGAAYWLGVLGIFTLCIAVTFWAALAAA